MANRRRVSFVDFAHPEAWHKLIEYAEVTITFAKLITDFTNQWAKICFLASSQLHQLVIDFRKKSDTEIRAKCHLGGMMYDLWESLLLESELESQSLKKMACFMEKEISGRLTNFMGHKNVQLAIYKQNRKDLNEILEASHEIVQNLQEEYTKTYDDEGVTPEFHQAHNSYVIELTGVNSLLSKYQYHILPQLLQGMEQSQIEVIDAICQNLHLIASLIQSYHEQRYRSFESFIVTSRTTNPNEELENYICTMGDNSSASSVRTTSIDLELFQSPMNKLTIYNSRSQHLTLHNTEHLIVYAAPIIQTQLLTRCRETAERLREVKKEKADLLVYVNKTPIKHNQEHHDQQQSEKKFLHQINDLMVKKHQLRLIELEEAVLLAQQELLKSHRHSMSSIGDSEHSTQKHNIKNMKSLWRDAFRTLKISTTSSSDSGDGESRSSFARRFSLRKKKKKHENEQDEIIIDPVYETLKIAAETRKKTVAQYLQQKQRTLNKQTSLNSQGSSEIDTQSSPRPSRQASGTDTEIISSLKPPLPTTSRPSPAIGKRYSEEHFCSVVQTYQLNSRHMSLENSPNNLFTSSEQGNTT